MAGDAGAGVNALTRPSDRLVADIIEQTLASLVATEDGHAWMADALRRRGWTVVGPAPEKDGRG